LGISASTSKRATLATRFIGNAIARFVAIGLGKKGYDAMQQQHVDTRAYQTEHGWQAQCPTTKETYLSTAARISSDGRYVSLACACCDALLHTGDQCDPTIPQWHLYNYKAQK